MKVHLITFVCVLFFGVLPGACGLKAANARSASGVAPRLAVLIPGLEDRFLYATKAHQVVAPAVAAGYAVDVYASMVASGYVNSGRFRPAVSGAIVNPEVANGSSRERLSEALRGVGGNLAAFFLLPTALEVESSFPADPPRRLTQYPVDSSEVGKNVMRRFKAIESLMAAMVQAEAASGAGYSFVLLTRDDDFWLGPLDLPSFAADPDSANRVYSKGCKNWDGINDKTLLFGRQAAGRVLGRIYGGFWTRDESLTTYNVEMFLQNFVKLQNVTSVPVEFKRLPTCDSVYVKGPGGGPALCQKGFYLCPGPLPAGGGFLAPEVCPFSLLQNI